MKKILLDTNFLLIPFQFNVDIFAEIHRIMHEKYEIYTLDKVVDELKTIINDKKQKQKDKKAAKLGLQLLKAKKVKILKTEKGFADDIIADLEGYIIATQDMALKRRLKGKKIVLRQKKQLIIL